MIKWEPQHRWEEVAQALRTRIENGQYAPRTRMPSIRDIMQEFEVGRNTVLRALDELKEQGLIVTRQSQGTFVTPPDDR